MTNVERDAERVSRRRRTRDSFACAFVVLGASWLVACPRAQPSPTHEPLVASADVSAPPLAEARPARTNAPVIEGCADAFLAPATLEGAVVLVVLRAGDGHLDGVVLDATTGTIARLAGAITSATTALHDLRVSGNRAAFDVRVLGDCAPDIGSPGQPVSCEEAHFVVRGSDVASSIKQVITGPDASPKPARLPVAWRKKIPASCIITEIRPLDDALLLVHANETGCPFGLGGVITTGGAILASVHDDENIVTVRASNVWYVGTGVDGKVESVRRVHGAALEEVAKLPSVATDLLSVGDRVIASTLSNGVVTLGPNGWDRIAGVCDPAGSSVEILDDQRALFTCASGVHDVLDARTLAVRRLPSIDHFAHATTVAAHDEIFVTDDRGALYATDYAGSTYRCTAVAGAFDVVKK